MYYETYGFVINKSSVYDAGTGSIKLHKYLFPLSVRLHIFPSNCIRIYKYITRLKNSQVILQD